MPCISLQGPQRTWPRAAAITDPAPPAATDRITTSTARISFLLLLLMFAFPLVFPSTVRSHAARCANSTLHPRESQMLPLSLQALFVHCRFSHIVRLRKSVVVEGFTICLDQQTSDGRVERFEQVGHLAGGWHAWLHVVEAVRHIAAAGEILA
eukprot:210980-Pleurochrysis_carterae.AAC.2